MMKVALFVSNAEMPIIGETKEAELERNIKKLQGRIEMLQKENSELSKKIIKYENIKPALKNINGLITFLINTI